MRLDQTTWKEQLNAHPDKAQRRVGASTDFLAPRWKVCNVHKSSERDSDSLHAMGRTTGKSNLPEAKRGALIALKQTNKYSNRQLAQTYDCDEKSVRNVLKRAEEAEAQNIDPFSTAAHQPRPKSGRTRVISTRTQRQLTRHATKDRHQRRKSWVTIAREIGCVASATTVNSVFERAGYKRYLQRRKPRLNAGRKLRRSALANERQEKLSGDEDIGVHNDETSVRFSESRGQIWVTRTKDDAYHPDCVV